MKSRNYQTCIITSREARLTILNKRKELSNEELNL